MAAARPGERRAQDGQLAGPADQDRTRRAHRHTAKHASRHRQAAAPGPGGPRHGPSGDEVIAGPPQGGAQAPAGERAKQIPHCVPPGEQMSLPERQQQILDQIEQVLQAADPRLKSMFAAFARLAPQGAEPVTEVIVRQPARRTARRTALICVMVLSLLGVLLLSILGAKDVCPGCRPIRPWLAPRSGTPPAARAPTPGAAAPAEPAGPAPARPAQAAYFRIRSPTRGRAAWTCFTAWPRTVP